MADLSGLLRAVEQRADVIFREAASGMKERIEAVVPHGEPDVLGRPRTGPVLRDTWQQSGPTTIGTTYRVTVGYTAPQAAFSNDLQAPHVITPRRPGYPLRFWSNLAGDEVRAMRVNHPGNANAASLGWWDKNVNDVTWRTELIVAAGL